MKFRDKLDYRIWSLAFLFALGSLSRQGLATGDVAQGYRLQAMVDSYFAYDFNRPTPPDRPLNTQASRHNEFNLNLAFVGVEWDDRRMRGRLALQTGTSVQRNYSDEPSKGLVSGPSLSQHIQEGFVGIRISPQLVVDMGIFFSHLGAESFISKDNWTYTRSLASDFSPHYQSGVRLLYQVTDSSSMQFHLING